jgi:hypothetical protein
MTETFKSIRKGLWFVAIGAIAAGLVAWAAVAAVTTLTPGLWLAAGAAILACGATYALVRRSRAAHDRAIRDTYPSFAPALARRRAEGNAGV